MTFSVQQSLQSGVNFTSSSKQSYTALDPPRNAFFAQFVEVVVRVFFVSS